MIYDRQHSVFKENLYSDNSKRASILDFPIHLFGGQVNETRREFGQQGFKPQPIFEFGLDIRVESSHGCEVTRLPWIGDIWSASR